MADPENLVKGNCYFNVGYIDSELFIPVIDTYIFIEEVDGDDRYWLFQDAEFFADQSEKCGYLAIPEDQLYMMLNIAELRTKLKGLLHLHPIVDNAPSKRVLLSDKNRTILFNKIKYILKKGDTSDSLTITTNYRDKGVSLSYAEGGVDIMMSLDCKEAPEEETIVRKIFSDLGINPISDYLSQHERVRIISYLVIENANTITTIVSDIFEQAYKIKENEKIDPHYSIKTEVKRP